MIRSRKDYIYYLESDKSRFKLKKFTFFEIITLSERYRIWRFIKNLRKLEFYINRNSKNPLHYFQLKFQYLKFYRIMGKTQLFIYPNVVGPGLCIPHIGYILVSSEAIIGKNFTIRPGCVIASNLGLANTELRKVRIGDDVELSNNCFILSKTIGDRVNIGANSVVLTNVPDNSIVIGNPAKIYPKIN